MPLKLLFIEDNEDILINLFAWFEAKNFSCDCARNGRAGLNMALKERFDCIVLDIMLPGLDGVSLCKALRDARNNTPVIMLTAKDAEADKIEGFESGADDYLIKPFSLKELEARIHALMRRSKNISTIQRFGAIELDSGRHAATRDGVSLRLSPGSFKILEALVHAAPGIARKTDLEEMLWGNDPPEGSALRNQIHELRKVLDKPFAENLLETVPHIGWRLRLPGNESEI